jgi:arylsulfatase A-like enzyme
MMYLAYNAVHTPMQATDEDMAKFEGHPRQKLAAMTYALDRGVGTVIRGLKDSGKFDNTLIFFLSDNGGATTNQSSNYPLKGFKGNKFEGGHRVPYFVVWKNGIPAGKPYDGLVSSLDIFATAIDAASISKTRNRLDGVSLLPYLKGKKGEPHKVLYWRKMDTRAIRSGDYKLIITHGVDSVLYNIRRDPEEMNNLINKEPDLYRKLAKKLAKWEKNECIEPSWLEEGWRKITNRYHQQLMHNEIKTAQDLYKKK